MLVVGRGQASASQEPESHAPADLQPA